MDDKVLEKKKGLNLMTKILITALIPLILIVVLAGVSIDGAEKRRDGGRPVNTDPYCKITDSD